MSRGLDWKWIGLGVLVMFGLRFLAALLLIAVWPGEPPATEGGIAQLTGIQVALLAAIGFLGFAIGGYIVGLKSAGRTIVEPGLSAAIAAVIGLLVRGNFTLLDFLLGGLLPFLAGLLGGWLGEMRQGTV